MCIRDSYIIVLLRAARENDSNVLIDVASSGQYFEEINPDQPTKLKPPERAVLVFGDFGFSHNQPFTNQPAACV